MLEIAIKTVLSNIIDIPIRPVFGIEIPCITYTDVPVSGGVVKQDQVELKIINTDYDEALEIKGKILKKLDMTGKEPALVSNGITFISQLAGGGSIFSDGPQAWEISLMFLITWRCL